MSDLASLAEGELMYRYEVVDTWGKVPDFVSRLVGQADAYMLYPEDRGEWSQQDYWTAVDGVCGGWALERRGAAVVKDKETIRAISEADVAAMAP